MRRLSAFVICGVALLLVSAPAAYASPALRQSGPPSLRPGAAIPFAGARTTSTYPLSGKVLSFDGSPMPGGWVSWGWYDPDGYSWYCPAAVLHAGGDGSTAGDGSFSFTDVTSLPAHDTLIAGGGESPGLIYAVLYHLDFSTTSDYVIRPGHVNVSVANAPARRAEVGLGDALYVQTQTSADLVAGDGTVDSLPPDFNSARVSFPNANGSVTAECEWLTPGLVGVPVTPGSVAATTVAVDWRSAVQGRIAGPRCRHAGRPGSTVRYKVTNLPAGEQLSFVGYSWTADWGIKSYSQVVTSTGPESTYTVSLRVPARATRGTVYDVDAQRSDDTQSMLWLYDYYEVCDLAATRSVIARGESVRLRGRAGALKATLYKRHAHAPRPATPEARGWTKVADLTVGAEGRLITPRLRPSRSTWYVVRFRGLGGGFMAFTPVVKVAVR
jgi:hypothetical protein